MHPSSPIQIQDDESDAGMARLKTGSDSAVLRRFRISNDWADNYSAGFSTYYYFIVSFF